MEREGRLFDWTFRFCSSRFPPLKEDARASPVISEEHLQEQLLQIAFEAERRVGSPLQRTGV
jgi:hypothetical protein